MVQDRRRVQRRLRRLKGRRDPAVVAGGLSKVASIIEASTAQAAARRSRLPIIPRRSDLPIEAMRDDLEAAIAKHQVIIVQGETGSGKTTRLPQMCLSIGRGVYGGIAHTQPRRIAARSVAKRIAWEVGDKGDSLVGHHVRFDRAVDDDALVTVMTDGMLLASIKSDPRLERWDTIILDEAHERSLNIDFLIGVIRSLLVRRPELRVIVTSATIDAKRFSDAFGGAPVLSIPGRTFPVDIVYAPPTDDIDDGNADALSKAVLAGVRAADARLDGQGDMLVFLPGEGEIRACMRRLEGQLGSRFDVIPLFARLSAAAQDNVMRGGPRRRIICATNVAETSLTVPRIRAVIDTGLARVSRFSAKRQVQRLPLEGISKASAKQRAGRAGRVAPGVCIRLWSEADHERRDAELDPEIRRSDLAGVLLKMADLDLGDALTFGFLDPPKAATVRAGWRVLEELGAVHGGTLTPLGRRMATLPVAPRIARMLIAGQECGCAESVLVIAAGMSIPDPRLRPLGLEAEAAAAHKPFVDRSSEFMTLLALWQSLTQRIRDEGSSATRRWCLANHVSWVRVIEWRDLAHQLRRALRAGGRVDAGVPASSSQVHKALLTGLLMQVGRRTEDGDYEAPGNRRFHLHPSSPLAATKPAWVMVGELVETRRLFGRLAAVVHAPWIEKAAAHLIEYRYERTRWESERGEATAARRSLLRGLTVSKGHRVPLARVEPDSARRRFIDHGLVDGDCALQWTTFMPANVKLMRSLEQQVEKCRQSNLLRGPSARFDFFDEALPAWVHSLDTLAQWLASDASAEGTLRLSKATLVHRDAVGTLDASVVEVLYPDSIETGAGRCPLVYRHRLGEADDGMSVRVGLEQIGSVDETRLAWLVPGWRHALVEALLRGLPKAQRRALAPLNEAIAMVLERLPAEPNGEIESAIERVSPLGVSAVALRGVDLPAHLVVRYEVLEQTSQRGTVDADVGRGVLAVGRDLGRLRRELAPRKARAVERLLRQHPMHGRAVDGWPVGLRDELGCEVDDVERGMSLPLSVKVGGVSAMVVLDRGQVVVGGRAARGGQAAGGDQAARGGPAARGGRSVKEGRSSVGARAVEGGRARLLLELDNRVAAERHRLGVRSLLCGAMGASLLSAVVDAARFDEARRWAALVEGLSDTGFTAGSPPRGPRDAAAHADDDKATFADQFGGCPELHPELQTQIAWMAVELAGGLNPIPTDADSFIAAQDTVWVNLVPSVEQAVALLVDHYQAVATLHDSIELASNSGRLSDASITDLRSQEAWLIASGIPADLPRTWWGQTAIWAKIAIDRANAGDPNGSALLDQLRPWLDRLLSVDNRRWHPAVVQFRLLIEAWRASLCQPSSATVRVDEDVLAQQWSIVQTTA